MMKIRWDNRKRNKKNDKTFDKTSDNRSDGTTLSFSNCILTPSVQKGSMVQLLIQKQCNEKKKQIKNRSKTHGSSSTLALN